MRTLSAILGLLLCLSPACADELPAIKDSEAVEYLGKKVEAPGLVLSATKSPLGPHLSISDEKPHSDIRWVHRGGLKNGD